MRCNPAWEIEASFDNELPTDGNRKGPIESSIVPGVDPNAPVAKMAVPSIIDQSSPTVDRFVGFNPYDTAVLQNKYGNS